MCECYWTLDPKRGTIGSFYLTWKLEVRAGNDVKPELTAFKYNKLENGVSLIGGSEVCPIQVSHC